jgi:hypothetical protein
LLKAMSVNHPSKFAALSMVTADIVPL